MYWKSRSPIVQDPSPFEKGWGKRFAFLPHKAEDGRTYWLEKVGVKLYWGPLTRTWRIDKWLGN